MWRQIEFVKTRILYDRLVLLENSVPTIRGPPGSDCSEAERDVLERAEEKMTKQEAWKGSMSAVPKTAADYVREAAQKTVRIFELLMNQSINVIRGINVSEADEEILRRHFGVRGQLWGAARHRDRGRLHQGAGARF